MCEILNFISEIKLYQIKDICNIIFWIATPILGYYTFSNAKKSLFNPVKSEMVKYQLKIITNFTDKYTTQGFNIDTTLDFLNIIKLNTELKYLLQDDYYKNIKSNEDIERLNFCKNNIDGLFELTIDNKELKIQPMYGDFDTIRSYIKTEFIIEKETNYKHLYTQRIYVTKKFNQFYNDIIFLNNNPFTPESIKSQSESIIKKLYFNIGQIYNLYEKDVYDETNTYFKIYNIFLSNRKDIQINIDHLNKEISNFYKTNKI